MLRVGLISLLVVRAEGAWVWREKVGEGREGWREKERNREREKER
jgi:hypothetical protein